MKEMTPAEFDAAIRTELHDVPAAQINSALLVVLGLNPNRTPQAIAAAVRSYIAEGKHHVLMADEVAEAEAVAKAETKAPEATPAAPDWPDRAHPGPAAAPAHDGDWIVQPDPATPRKNGSDA
ncbi:MAG: hypothetical protein V4505_10355 [Pseudomonadota bacterium]